MWGFSRGYRANILPPTLNTRVDWSKGNVAWAWGNSIHIAYTSSEFIMESCEGVVFTYFFPFGIGNERLIFDARGFF
jgi:hypothetical protein